MTFIGWEDRYLSVQFTHDPGIHTRSYTILLRTPGSSEDIAYGGNTIIAIGATTSPATGITFKRLGPTGWEWQKIFDLLTEPDGTYQAAVKAVGDGGITGLTSGSRTATLHSSATFEQLLEDIPIRAVASSTVRKLPITMRLSNPLSDLYYRYRILDGDVLVWESGYIKQTQSSKIEATFSNLNSYPLGKGRSYRIRVDSFDNDSGRESAVKQKSAEITFIYDP